MKAKSNKTSLLIVIVCIAVIFQILICIFSIRIGIWYFTESVPRDGIWVCDDPYVRFDLDSNIIEIEEDGAVNKYDLGHGEERYFSISPLSDESVEVIYPICDGYMIRYGDKLHIQIDYFNLDCWLYKSEN